jgi:hypothetical protein
MNAGVLPGGWLALYALKRFWVAHPFAQFAKGWVLGSLYFSTLRPRRIARFG